MNGNVSSNKTIIDGKLENGCEIIIANGKKKTLEALWQQLSESEKFTCAYVKTEKITSGCIFDILGKSNCPGAD